METGVELSEEGYTRLSSKHISKDLIEAKEKLLELKVKANAIIKMVKPFNFPVFTEKFNQKNL